MITRASINKKKKTFKFDTLCAKNFKISLTMQDNYHDYVN